MKTIDIIAKLCGNAHRGMGSKELGKAQDWLVSHIKSYSGVQIERQEVKTAKTYIPFMLMVMWPLAFFMFGRYVNMPFAILSLYLCLELWLFFDWRGPQLQRCFGNTKGHNIIAKKGSGSNMLILMAHVDSAPSSFAYRPSQVKHYAFNVMIGLFLVSLASAIQLYGSLVGFDLISPVVTSAIALLLILLSLVTMIDYLFKGFVPGANDNGSGVATALKSAEQLWHDMPDDSEVWLVLTTAEEAGMLGAYAFWQKYGPKLKEKQAKVINIDTVGQGALKVVTKTGAITKLSYDNILTTAARSLIADCSAFSTIEEHHHLVGDFDSVWMARDGLDVITLAAYDENGLMPYIHTKFDIMGHLDEAVMQQTIDFAQALLRKVAKD